MSERKKIAILAGFVLSVSLIAVSITAALLTNYHNRIYFQALGEIFQEIIERQPEAEQAVILTLKDYQYEPASIVDESVIYAYGYRQTDFLKSVWKIDRFFAAVSFLAGMALFFMTFFFWRKKERSRIKALTEYLEKMNTGGGGVLLGTCEDDFSKLQDEICKTVTRLHQTRDMAIKAKSNFAENLYNIAHQIKTPITSISLSLQMMQETPSWKHLEQIRRQLSRLTHLEEALLLLSRIDAGAFSMERKEVDVFTLLMLAADNLQELFQDAEVLVDIPESGETMIRVDLDWTMEAIMNLLKNCMEHTPQGGAVRCSYEQNPLYTQIRIWDTGAGFAKEDIPHLFERFYRGKNAKKEGIGIGLALSRAIIESQNGTVSAGNLVDGGTCFEIRFYAA